MVGPDLMLSPGWECVWMVAPGMDPKWYVFGLTLEIILPRGGGVRWQYWLDSRWDLAWCCYPTQGGILDDSTRPTTQVGPGLMLTYCLGPWGMGQKTTQGQTPCGISLDAFFLPPPHPLHKSTDTHTIKTGLGHAGR